MGELMFFDLLKFWKGVFHDYIDECMITQMLNSCGGGNTPGQSGLGRLVAKTLTDTRGTANQVSMGIENSRWRSKAVEIGRWGWMQLKDKANCSFFYLTWM